MHRRALVFASIVCSAAALPACKHVSSGSPGQAAAAAPPTGLARFARHERFFDVKLSPGGTYLAATTWEGGKRALAFINLATRKYTFLLRPASVSMVGRFWWVSDERVVVELVQGEGDLAAPRSYGELYAVDATGTNGRLIFGYRAGEMETGSHAKTKPTRTWGVAEVIATVRGQDRYVLAETMTADGGQEQHPKLVQLDVHTGRQAVVTTSPIPAATFAVDAQGEPRLAYGATRDFDRVVYYREAGSSSLNPFSSDWAPLPEVIQVGKSATVLGLWSAAKVLYLVEPNGKGTEGLFAVDLVTGAKKLLSSNPAVPPSGIVTDPDTGEAIAVEYEPDLPRYEILKPEHPIARLLSSVLAAFPDEHVQVASLTDDRKKALVRVYSDRDPGRYLLVDTASFSAEPALSERDWIDPAAMAEMGAFTFVASDGLVVHGYLTLPPSLAPGTPAPLVVMPHGGPHDVRDHWKFDPDVQLLASEGMAVLQVNFRGSDGYGQEFEDAGYRHWGDRVQQDIIEATRFVIGKGFADPRRVCIYGASFGGYSAMQSAILAPDLFRCAVGYAGVYDLAMMPETDEVVANHRAQGWFQKVLGEDATALAAASPVHHADRLTAPVLLIHGEKDERAPIEHAEELRSALERRGRHVEWLVEPLEGHGFYDEGARERMYARLVAFLKESLRAP